MDKQEIIERVNEIIVDKLGVDPEEIKPETKLEEDLNADSLDAVEIIMELEHEFNISITDQTMHDMSDYTVQQIYDLVTELA